MVSARLCTFGLGWLESEMVKMIDFIKFWFWVWRHGKFEALRKVSRSQYENDYSTYCYFIGNRQHGVVKIGFSVEPATRIAQLQTGCPYPLELLGKVPGDELIEQGLHRVFSSLRMNGEWFKLNHALSYYVALANDEYVARTNEAFAEGERKRLRSTVGGTALAALLAVWTALVIAIYRLVSAKRTK